MKTYQSLFVFGAMCLAPVMTLASEPSSANTTQQPTKMIYLAEVAQGNIGAVRAVVDAKGNVSLTNGSKSTPVYDPTGKRVHCLYFNAVAECKGGSFQLTPEEIAKLIAFKKAFAKQYALPHAKSASLDASNQTESYQNVPTYGGLIQNK